MNSDHPLFKNYMALYLCINKEYSISQALAIMGILEYKRNRREKK